MDRTRLVELLEAVAAGRTPPAEAAAKLSTAAAAELGPWAKVDLQRSVRTGLPEIVYGESKTAEQCARIAHELDLAGEPVLVTRLDESKSAAVIEAVPGGRYHPSCRVFAKGRGPDRAALRGPVAVVAAGTSDLPWAEEAAVTLETIGQPVERFYDVGVAGLHRLLSRIEAIRRAGVVIVVAGMEGALASVVGGLVAVPVVAVPAPVGYGVALGGVAPLLGMLTACSPNVAVVNIGNGLGAACFAALANRTGPAANNR
jgi:hypothetical protein